VVLVGWSNGTFNVWQYLHDCGGDRIAAVVLIDASPCPLNRNDWSLGYWALRGLIGAMEAREADNQRFVRDVFLPRIFGNLPEPKEADWMAEEILMMPATIAAAFGFQAMTRDYRNFVSGVRVPALLCFGARSFVRLENATYLQGAMEDARLVVFAESGHSPFWEEADRFNHELSTFIDTLPI